MVEKLSLNNELILMKKTIAQAKVCVIGRLVKKLRDAKKQLETADPKPLKLSTRPAKLAEQIDYLKHAENVALATKCLVEQRVPHQLLTNAQASNEDVAWATLASYKTVATRIAEIKLKYGLADTKVDWRASLAETGKKKQKKNIKEAHLKRKAAQKERKDKEKAAELKRSEWLEENGEGDEAGVKADSDAEDDAEQRSGDENGADEGSASEEGDESVEQSDDEAEATSNESGASDTEAKPKAKKTPKPAKPSAKPKSATTNTKPASKAASAATKPAAAAPKAITKKIAAAQAPISRPAPPPPKRQMDSFFVTAGGSAYMSTGFEERHQPAGPNDGMDRRERRAQQFGKAAPRRAGNQAGAQPPRLANKPYERKPYEKSNNVRAGAGGAAAAPEANLHPSWAAKQRTKGIANFQGSKKTFGDDDNDDEQQKPKASQSQPPRKPHVAPSANGGRGGAAKTPQEADAEKLHPSWVAKQKLKPVIGAFQGTKITFD